MTALRLQTTYTSPTIWDAPTDTLMTVLTAARQFADDRPPGPVHPADAIAAVAAAAIAAQARNRAERTEPPGRRYHFDQHRDRKDRPPLQGRKGFGRRRYHSGRQAVSDVQWLWPD